MRAVAESSETARLLGVNPGRVARLAWALGMGLAAIAAGLSTPITGLSIQGLQGALFFAFTGIFLGGLTSMQGAVVGGLAIGILDNWAAYLPKFKKVMPVEYRRALAELEKEQARLQIAAE
jgi:branched-chain amino acid transport system permease protein